MSEACAAQELVPFKGRTAGRVSVEARMAVVGAVHSHPHLCLTLASWQAMTVASGLRLLTMAVSCSSASPSRPPGSRSTLFSRLKSAHSTCSTSRSTTGRMLPPSPSSGRDARGSLQQQRTDAATCSHASPVSVWTPHHVVDGKLLDVTQQLCLPSVSPAAFPRCSSRPLLTLWHSP